MIKKGCFFILFFCFLSSASAQQRSAVSQKITIQDLEPKVNYEQTTPFYQPLRENSGLALISSAIVPGSGQAANKKWLRAGLYLLAEAALVGVHLQSYHNAKQEERRYEQFANSNWSVVTYAQWLVNYHNQNNLQNAYIDELKNQVEGVSPEYNPSVDWKKVDLEVLRNVERNTPFVYPDQIGNNFSHVMPDYGSQQYYELISKYYQYGPGWNDFGRQYQLPWDGSEMPGNFVRGATLADDFNDSYRLAGNMVSLIILNHVVSAFDAFLTVKINNKRLEADSNFMNPERNFSLKFHF